MNIYLLIEALSETEKQELKDYFIKKEQATIEEVAHKISLLTPIEDFVRKNSDKLPVRILNIILYKDYPENKYHFPFAEHITKREFMRMRNAGNKSWKILEPVLAAGCSAKNNGA